MKKDGKTNSLKMTDKKEKHVLTTVHFPVRKSFLKMVPLTATSAMFPLQGKGRVAEQFSPPGQ